MKSFRIASLVAPLALIACAQAASATVIEVMKSPYCGCCTEWVERMRAAGFTVEVTEVEDTAPAAKSAGIPDNLRSCHTATVEGYAIEGHVPAEDIRTLLAKKPDAVGLAVPGMPVGSPGMEMEGRAERYQVVLVARDGQHRVFATHGGTADAHVH
ncbi:DUF411 domain-containing protein [Qipengyuania sp. NPDC077563]|uniref:DUF411 domain-containing protein n=1 Tax=Qipengyuania sp. NPDC077563 TaxID=3364497 RepID=UPI00384F12C2